MRWVRELFPAQLASTSTPALVCCMGRSVLAHGIWLDDTDRAVLRAASAQIAQPLVNLFLGSGLFRLAEAEAVGACGDAGQRRGRRHHSMLRTMADAWGAGHGGMPPDRLEGAARRDAWRGGPRAGARDRIAGGRAGWPTSACGTGPPARWPSAMEVARELHEKVFAWLTLGDERNLSAAYGRRAKDTAAERDRRQACCDVWS